MGNYIQYTFLIITHIWDKNVSVSLNEYSFWMFETKEQNCRRWQIVLWVLHLLYYVELK